jgi:hypothetical protein
VPAVENKSSFAGFQNFAKSFVGLEGFWGRFETPRASSGDAQQTRVNTRSPTSRFGGNKLVCPAFLAQGRLKEAAE